MSEVSCALLEPYYWMNPFHDKVHFVFILSCNKFFKEKTKVKALYVYIIWTFLLKKPMLCSMLPCFHFLLKNVLRLLPLVLVLTRRPNTLKWTPFVQFGMWSLDYYRLYNKATPNKSRLIEGEHRKKFHQRKIPTFVDLRFMHKWHL